MKEQHLPTPGSDTTERARIALRVEICRQCPHRDPGSDHQSAGLPRTCEKQCALFKQLPQLITVGRCIDPMLGSFDQIMAHQLHHLNAQATTFPATHSTPAASRPAGWSRRIPHIIRILRNLVRA